MRRHPLRNAALGLGRPKPQALIAFTRRRHALDVTGKMYLQVSQLRDELDRATRKSKAAQQRVTTEENCTVS